MTKNLSPSSDEFYVGYLPVPLGLRRFLRVSVPMIVVLAVLTAFVLSWQQQDPGNGSWDLSQTVSLHGVIETEPYTILRVTGENGDVTHTVLLVSQGKIGAALRAAPFVGKSVVATGNLIRRDGMKMLELLADGSALQLQNTDTRTASGVVLPSVQILGRATLKGEIMDAKCYLGVMKPGEGKVHKGCATRCISGGIPPLFVTRDSVGVLTFYLLTDSQGDAIGDRILPFVADPIEVTGGIERRDGVLIFKIDSTTIQRL